MSETAAPTLAETSAAGLTNDTINRRGAAAHPAAHRDVHGPDESRHPLRQPRRAAGALKSAMWRALKTDDELAAEANAETPAPQLIPQERLRRRRLLTHALRLPVGALARDERRYDTALNAGWNTSCDVQPAADRGGASAP
jgi:hypothetical protein